MAVCIRVKKKRFSYLLAVVMILSAGMCLGWADSWEAIKSATQDIHTIRADFVQEKHLEILARPLVSRGVFYFSPPDSLRWEYQQPLATVLLMHNGRSTRYVVKDGRLAEDRGINLSAMQTVLAEIAMWLNGRFTENPNFTAELKNGGKIVLRPKEESFSAIIERIILTFSTRPGIIETVRIEEGPKSFTQLTFANVVLNQPLAESLFKKVE
jgi:outer membrane lipoprotein-sorting protein